MMQVIALFGLLQEALQRSRLSVPRSFSLKSRMLCVSSSLSCCSPQRPLLQLVVLNGICSFLRRERLDEMRIPWERCASKALREALELHCCRMQCSVKMPAKTLGWSRIKFDTKRLLDFTFLIAETKRASGKMTAFILALSYQSSKSQAASGSYLLTATVVDRLWYWYDKSAQYPSEALLNAACQTVFVRVALLLSKANIFGQIQIDAARANSSQDLGD